jgi:UDP-N-acetylmuramoyl-L-alanyl-D-glutamate--2,6-diaminopimelate ligase
MSIIERKFIRLTQLLQSLPEPTEFSVISTGGADAVISGLAYDSRQVIPGDLFFALVGGNQDGHRFIQGAINKGAVAVVGQHTLGGLSVPYIQVPNSREALAYLSAGFYGHPARKLTMIGVTGTDGKTTTTNLIYQILRSAGLRVGMISTVNAIIGEQVYDTGFHVTTPEAPTVQRLLSQMVAKGLSHVVLEVTSHGLAQHRVTACEIDIGIVTNITHEHLDFHGSYEAYRAAKASVFDILARKHSTKKGRISFAVLNKDDSSYDFLASYIRSARIAEGAQINIVSYGLTSPAMVTAEGVSGGTNGIDFTAVGPGFRLPVFSWLEGSYNVSNCLAAIAATAICLGIDPPLAAQGIYQLRSVPGRMERLELGTEFLTIIDFAHTPNALYRALVSVREMVSRGGQNGRVIAVFGSAGLRDRAKRRMMAEVAIDHADISILTAEDPRTEILDDILAEMAEGCMSKGGIEGVSFHRIRDRGEAIRYALSLARPGDAVVALGKGHEQSMCFGEVEYAWDDRIAMRAAVTEYLGVPGPAMPYLPTQDID